MNLLFRVKLIGVNGGRHHVTVNCYFTVNMFTVFGIRGPYSGVGQGYDLVVCDAVSMKQPTINHKTSLQYGQNYYCICTVHVIRSHNCQYQHMHNFSVTG